MVSLLHVFIWWDLVPTSPWGKLHLVPTAMLIVTMLSIRTHSVIMTHSFYRYRFPWRYIVFSLLYSSVSSQKNPRKKPVVWNGNKSIPMCQYQFTVNRKNKLSTNTWGKYIGGSVSVPFVVLKCFTDALLILCFKPFELPTNMSRYFPRKNVHKTDY